MKSWFRFCCIGVALLAGFGCGKKADEGGAGVGKPPAGQMRTQPGGQNVVLNGKTLKITVMDIGQGDSTLIETPSGKTVLIDAGLPGSQDKIEPILREHHVSKLDFIVDSHPHNDHIGGMGKLLEEVPFDTVYDSALVTNAPAQTRLLKAIKAGGGKFVRARKGMTVPIDNDVTMEILQPQDPLFQESDKNYINNDSVIVRFVFGKTRLLFTGDMEEVERARLYESGADIRADFLKIAHHGSRNGTDAEFLGRVKPQIATISCATGNSFGHPHAEAIQALQATQIALYRTDLSGTIVINCDAEGHLQALPSQIAESNRVYQPGDDRQEQKRRRRKR